MKWDFPNEEIVYMAIIEWPEILLPVRLKVVLIVFVLIYTDEAKCPHIMLCHSHRDIQGLLYVIGLHTAEPKSQHAYVYLCVSLWICWKQSDTIILLVISHPIEIIFACIELHSSQWRIYSPKCVPQCTNELYLSKLPEQYIHMVFTDCFLLLSNLWQYCKCFP